jgi:hypothetical protein
VQHASPSWISRHWPSKAKSAPAIITSLAYYVPCGARWSFTSRITSDFLYRKGVYSIGCSTALWSLDCCPGLLVVGGAPEFTSDAVVSAGAMGISIPAPGPNGRPGGGQIRPDCGVKSQSGCCSGRIVRNCSASYPGVTCVIGQTFCRLGKSQSSSRAKSP